MDTFDRAFDRDYRDDPRYKGHCDNISAFVEPRPIDPKKVRNVFNQTHEYIDVMHRNTMADYSAFYSEKTKQAHRQQRDWTPACVKNFETFGSTTTIEVSMAVEDNNLNWSLVIVSDKRGHVETYISQVRAGERLPTWQGRELCRTRVHGWNDAVW